MNRGEAKNASYPNKSSDHANIMKYLYNTLRNIAPIWLIAASDLLVMPAYGQGFLPQVGNSIAATNVLSPVPSSGLLLVDYDFYVVPDTLDVFYDGSQIFASGWL